MAIGFIAIIVLRARSLWGHIKAAKFIKAFFILAGKIIPAITTGGFTDPNANLIWSERATVNKIFRPIFLTCEVSAPRGITITTVI